ncbi:MAG: SgcJ/EcaC family oxidoreductase [Thermoanaerobaculia bacterium]
MSVRPVHRTFAVAALVLASIPLCAGSIPRDAASVPAGDEEAIRSLLDRYRTAWLANDSSRVLACFTADAVLLPANASAPVAGRSAILEHWWPANAPRTTILAFDQPIDRVAGDGDFAVAYGSCRVEWTTEGANEGRAQSSRSLFLTVLRRQSDGRWLIETQIWTQIPSS